MFSLVIAIAAATQTPAPKAAPATYTAADYCAEFGDYAFVIMEDVKKGRDAGSMLVSAQKAATDAGKEILTELVMAAFDANRITGGTITPKRFSDEAVLECYTQLKDGKEWSPH